MPMIDGALKADNILDFAIIGGGVAGLYLAWRLTGSKCSASDDGRRESNVQLFEGEDRVGGRLLTRKMPGMEFLAELGGMRYTSQHILLKNLVRKLGLKEKEFVF